MIQILLVDSDEGIRTKIKNRAEEAGYAVDEAGDGVSAVKMFRRKVYDLVIMDVYLPELDGINVCRQIRKISDAFIIFLTAKGRETDRLVGFEAGADDYILKPFYVSELMARISTILRRCRNQDMRSVLYSDGVSVHLHSRAVYVDDVPIALAPKEYELLIFLLENRNIALSRETILDQIWGEDFEGTDRTVDTHIRMLREHIKPYGDRITTVWGIGYKFDS